MTVPYEAYNDGANDLAQHLDIEGDPSTRDFIIESKYKEEA